MQGDSSKTDDGRHAKGVTSTSMSMLDRLRDQDTDAWDRFVMVYTPLVYHWCQKHNLTRDDIPDVVQDIFNAVSQKLADFRKEQSGGSFRGWLRTITRSKAMDHYRRAAKQVHAAGGSEAQQRMTEFAEDLDDAVASEAEDRQERELVFHRALELIRTDFAEQTWQAFWRVVVDDRKPKDVAEELGLSAGAVRVAKCRVLQRLRTDLGEDF